MTGIEIDAAGDGTAAEMLARIARRARQPRPAFHAIFKLLREGEREVFATRGATIGEAWPGLAKATKRIKGHGQPLRASGDLIASLTLPLAPGRVADVAGQAARFGTGLFYARFVARRRPMVGASQSTSHRAGEAMLRFLLGHQS